MAWLTMELLGLSAVVIAAGVGLTKSADRIAEATGLGRLLVGVVLLAGATSLPEMTVGWAAVRMGAIDLTVGNLLGAVLCNMFNLAIVDLVTRRPQRLLSYSGAGHALSGGASVNLMCLVLLGLLVDQTFMIGRLSGASVAIIAVYFAILRLVCFDELAARKEAPEPAPDERPRLGPAAAAFAASAIVILIVAPKLAAVADEFAEASGLGRTFMGTLLVAAVTTLPEVVASYTAIRMGQVDLAIGNAFGSNSFNMLILGVLDFATPGSLLGQASPVHAVTAVCGILVVSVTILTLLYRVEKRILFIEPDALLVALLVVGSMGLVYVQSR